MGDFSNFPVLFTEEDDARIMRENVEIEKGVRDKVAAYESQKNTPAS